MDLDNIKKENARFGNFFNKHLLIVAFFLQFPYLLGWTNTENIEGFIAINTFAFIFFGFIFSIIGNFWIKFKISEKQEEISDKITILKINECASKGLHFVAEKNDMKYLKKSAENLNHHIKKCNNKTTAEYLEIGKNNIRFLKIGGLLLVSLVVSFFAHVLIVFLNQLDFSFYEILILLLTLAFAIAYGYRSGIDLTLVYDIYPIILINLSLDIFMKENNIDNKEVTFEDKKKVFGYDYNKDKIIL